MADNPTSVSIAKFAADYGKRPAIVLTFLDWGKFPSEIVTHDVYAGGSFLMVTWEPWVSAQKTAIDYDAVLRGRDDVYIREFALKLKAIGRPVFLRFAHEMNGDWYPWSAKKIGAAKYQQLFRYVRGIFDKAGAVNVRWVFSINVENVPAENDYRLCYPGDRFVDYVGLDGYNWGTTKAWSHWRNFEDLFSKVYAEVTGRYRKSVIISEFGTTSAGGDKAEWVAQALKEIKRMPQVKGFVLFNIDKETDWRITPEAAAGRRLKEELQDPYFLETFQGKLS